MRKQGTLQYRGLVVTPEAPHNIHSWLGRQRGGCQNTEGEGERGGKMYVGRAAEQERKSGQGYQLATYPDAKELVMKNPTTLTYSLSSPASAPIGQSQPEVSGQGCSPNQSIKSGSQHTEQGGWNPESQEMSSTGSLIGFPPGNRIEDSVCL